MDGDPFAQAEIPILAVLDPLTREPGGVLPLLAQQREAFKQVRANPASFHPVRSVEILAAAWKSLPEVRNAHDRLQANKQAIILLHSVLRLHFDKAKKNMPEEMMHRFARRVYAVVGEKTRKQMDYCLWVVQTNLALAEDGIGQTLQRASEVDAELAALARQVHDSKLFAARRSSCLARLDYESFLDTMTAKLEHAVGHLEDLRKMIHGFYEWDQRLSKAEKLYARKRE